MANEKKKKEDIISKFNEFLGTDNVENLSYTDFLIEQFIGVFKALKEDKQKVLEFIDMIPEFYLNFDKYLLKTNEVNREHYNQIRTFLEYAIKIDKPKTLNSCKSYISNVRTKYPLQLITRNLLIIQDHLSKLTNITSKIPLKEYDKKLWITLQELIENNQKQKFLDYFFDWALKYAYIIEAFLKEYLMLVLKIECIANNEDFGKNYTGDETIGKIMMELEGSKNDMNFIAIRNAVFHANFMMEYKINFEQRKIVFKKLKGKPVEISIKEFVQNYFSIVQTVQTEILCITYFLMSLNRPLIKKTITLWTNTLKKFIEAMKAPSDEEIEKFRVVLKESFKSENPVFFQL